MRLRDYMVACKYVEILCHQPGVKQFNDETIFDNLKGIIARREHKTLLVLGSNEQMIKDVRTNISYLMKESDYTSCSHFISYPSGLTVHFVNVNMPKAIIGFSPDYVYII